MVSARHENLERYIENPAVVSDGERRRYRVSSHFAPSVMISIKVPPLGESIVEATVSRWVNAAWEQAGRPCRLLHAAPTIDHLARFGALYDEWGAYMTDERPVGVPTEELAVYVELYGRDLDRKLAALSAMASQTRDLMASTGDVYLAAVSEEFFVDATRSVPAAPGRAPLTAAGAR